MPSGAQNNIRGRKSRRIGNGSAAVAAARNHHQDTTKFIIGIVVVLLVAAGVVGGVLVSEHQKEISADSTIPVKMVPGSSNYPQVLDKDHASVLVGKPTAKVTIDAYEDFECPDMRSVRGSDLRQHRKTT